MKRALLFALAGAVLIQITVGREQRAIAASTDALTFFKNYFVTGDYVVGGVGVRGTGVNGIATANIDMTNASIPDGVDVLAAFLYWETVTTSTIGTTPTGATFRGHDISTIARILNPAGTAPCWSSGGGTGSADNGAHELIVYRADVLRYIPIGPDGKHLVKTTHQIQLPDAGAGNSVPSTAGASLVVVYRDPTMPLRAIVMFDGGYTMDQSTHVMNQSLRGFYQAATNGGKMTHIVGNGQANFSEQLLFNGQVIATNPFVGALGPSWDNPTFDVTASPALTDPASTSVTPPDGGSFDCLSWGAVIFSTTVQDTDGDGLLDIWESSTSTLYDPNGQPLPNLNAMGADPNAKDIFIEVGYMNATESYTNPIQGTVPPHSHLLTKAAIDMLGTALKNAPVTNPNGSTGIRLHVDVGANYQTTPPDPFIVPANLARGGEAIPETACVPTATHPCQFPDYRGTVGWKSAYHFYRDQPLNYSTELDCLAAGANCIRRFDSNRKNMFRYALFVHAVGLPRSDDPNSPLNHVPKNTSGIADLLGADMMVALGFWDDFTGTDFMQASTLMHELGHNLALRHGSAPLEPNCKPNYQSVMNYLFQARGLLNLSGKPVLDYSRQSLPSLDPNVLSESAPFNPATTMPYTTRWYSPVASSFIDSALGTTPATHHCNGSPITEGVGWVRVDGTTLGAPIDWNANGMNDAASYAQDVSFNGVRTALGALPVLNGGNDWARIDLRQIGGRRNVGSARIGGGLSLDVGYGDVGYGDVGYGDVGYGDVGYGDVGYGDVGYGDVGYGDVGYGDVGTGDLGYGDVGAPRGDMDLDTATSLGNAPDSLATTLGKGFVSLAWAKPHVGKVNFYSIYRVIGTSVTLANFPLRVLVGTVPAPTTTFVDSTVKNNTTYTYFVVAKFLDGTQSGVSNFSTITVK